MTVLVQSAVTEVEPVMRFKEREREVVHAVCTAVYHGQDILVSSINDTEH